MKIQKKHIIFNPTAKEEPAQPQVVSKFGENSLNDGLVNQAGSQPLSKNPSGEGQFKDYFSIISKK